ncbi:MAG TPA: pentapeptide repeat-containing protein [Streptosporangiaceae bacterium]
MSYLANPVFAGKFRWQSTNVTGQKFFMSYTSAAGQTLPTMSSTHSNDASTIWTAYEAAGGTVVIVSDVGQYLAIQPDDNTAILVPEASQATPVKLAPDAGTGRVRILSGPLMACYELDTGLPATLIFLASAGSDALAAFAQTTITPSLADIRSSNSAAHCDLTGVNLTGAVLTGVDCTQARFDHAILTGVNLSGATLTGASFPGLDLMVVDWGKDVSAAGADFSHTVAAGLAMPSTVTGGKRATFDNAAFTGADWSGCDLTSASLHNAFLTGANFSGATLTSAYLNGLQGGKSNDATVPGVDLSFAHLPDANLNGANLNGANLSRAQIYIMDTGASLLNADLTEADFSGADLTGANFGGPGSALAGTNFDGAILFQATFTGAALQRSPNGIPASMVGARLESATFSNVQFAGVGMSGARIAVAAGQGQAGVPLFTIASGVPACVATLGQLKLPSVFTGPSGLFASAGSTLSDTAAVSVVTAGQFWTLTQSATLATPGMEDVVYSVVLTNGTLEVYASGVSLVEQGDAESSFASTYTVTATALPPASLSPDTRCPNRATKGVNDQRGLSWPQAMTARRPSLASLDQVGQNRISYRGRTNQDRPR